MLPAHKKWLPALFAIISLSIQLFPCTPDEPLRPEAQALRE